MNLDGSNPINLSNHPAHEERPAQSINGDKIAFNSDRDGNMEIYAMNPDGTGQTNLTNNAAWDDAPDWAPSETTSPTTPSNVNAIPISSSQINLSWNASTDNIGVAGYRIYNADTNAEIATTASTSYSHNSLNPDTTYSYYVKAYDGGGNLSSSSSTASATTYKAPVPTSTGTDVPASLGNNVSLSFDQVTGSGTTSVTVSTTAPAPSPSGFNLLGLYYDVSTTATFSGKIRVTFPYDESQVTVPEADLRLFHWEGGVWKDVTVLPVDTVNNLITGEVTSLSPFGVGSPSGSVTSTGYNTYWLLIVAISLMIGGGCLLLKGKRRLV